ncbi:MAG: ribonuclease D [Rhodospirillaceae bacterium]|jgi:ribonuclease D|nr:ribonuclease D [Rhodospirillaceae bacterium]MBT7771097.1 ribonuclease D [Rhodospirillales bacterium]MBT4699624.1 ribonuclease D [Rhodospirillaceae bacterium]MBT5035741.1 ribonuclease D [Rhodospirillaceae bacterium]MBT6218744.1 ribonuclease D [Rhodospirillaceae bacterium]
MALITDNTALQELCGRLSKASYITVDTEFMREKTYWPILCLVQVAGPDEAWAIDPLAEGLDLSPLFDLFADENILKVFHAGRQDLEIFYHLAGRLPKPVFDSQIAAMVCGYGDSVGYDTLIGSLTGVRIDKSSRFTDWSVRPLSDRQIDYALGDVTHLRVAYEKLKATLESNGRADWLVEEMAVLTAAETYYVDPARAYLRLKVRNPKPRLLAVLREVAGWRQTQAETRDLPRNRVLRDEALLEIAHHVPKTTADLERVRGLGKRMAENASGQELLDAVKRGLAVPDAECPKPKNRARLPADIGPTAELLKVLLKMKCVESGVAQKLVASSADVDLIAAYGEEADAPALHGWRRDLFGEDALKLKEGAMALAVRNKKVAVVPVD